MYFQLFEQDELTEMSKKMVITVFQVDHLREEVAYKEAQVLVEHLKNMQLVKELENIRVSPKDLYRFNEW